MTLEAARTLVTQADANPAEAAMAARAVLADVVDDEPLDGAQAIAAWALGLALRHLRELDESRAWLLRAVDGLEPGSDDHTRAVMTLTGVLAFTGEFDEADRLLAALDPSEELAPRVNFQRANIAGRVGDLDRAEQGYATALEQFRANGDRLGEAHTCNGLGLMAATRGRPSEAFDHFGRAREIYLELELDLLAVLARGNMGWAATRAGDLVAAVELLETAKVELREHGEPYIETELDHAEALMLLGRRTEALERTAAAIRSLQASGASADRAELLVALAMALFATGHPDVAERSLETADRLFEDQGRASWRHVVTLRRLQAMPDLGTDVVADALRVGDQLRDAGLDAEATDADLLAVGRGWPRDDSRLDRPLERLRTLDRDDLRRVYADAVSALLGDDPQEACAIVRRAIAQATTETVGATTLEVRIALARLRDGITQVGVHAARRADDPATIVWIVSALQQLALRPAGSQAASDGLPHPVVDGAPSPQSGAAPDITLLDDGTELVCVRVDGGSMSFVSTPDRATVMDLVDRHDAVLREALGSEGSPVQGLLDATAAALRAHLSWLDGDGPLALALTGDLARAPWTSLAARPVRIVAELAPGAVPAPGTTMVVGPGLLTQDEEVAELEAVLGEQLRIASGDPLDAIAAARGATLHLSCHGHHHVDNPMLSTYELADGTVSALEIEALDAAPALVVAAACRAAAAQPAGVSTLGLPTAWLAAGTSTVVASTYTIPDDLRTVAAVARIHAELAHGVSPEEAVWRARADGDDVVARALSVVGRLAPHGSRSSRTGTGADHAQ
ncbi:tetratricopeptide repeat protein [Salsipaludibacter albus]|uniref:tetratricopeptide repeat protein n=1 Tax=Salsipaludibacter albus TaxID=2849650 RepID=UPI001EE4A66A|nr:tetratricopeptide repeat protein [Salsipaludibacter albus]MBY5163464.1 tetratricopeptide repeat protein [Salsipaludibacter albus]